MKLHERALLASLNISLYEGTKRDRTATQTVERVHKGVKLGRFNKDLINPAYLESIKKIAGSARTFLYEQTVPWGNDDSRLVPTAKYLPLQERLLDYKGQFDTAKRTIIKLWPDIIGEAEKRLATLFNPAEYPSAATLENKYQFRLRFAPVPHESVLTMLALDADHIEQIREQVTESNKQMLAESMNSVWERLLEKVDHMATSLSDPEKIFRDSMVDNLIELCDTLPQLNFTEDKKLERTLGLVKKRLIKQPDSLRRDPELRARTAEEARKISDAMKTYLEA